MASFWHIWRSHCWRPWLLLCQYVVAWLHQQHPNPSCWCPGSGGEMGGWMEPDPCWAWGSGLWTPHGVSWWVVALPSFSLVSVVACEWTVLARCLMCLAVPSCLLPLSVVLGGGWGFGGHSCRLVAALELGARFAPSILYLRQYQSQKVFHSGLYSFISFIGNYNWFLILLTYNSFIWFSGLKSSHKAILGCKLLWYPYFCSFVFLRSLN